MQILDPNTWASSEFGNSELGDIRRTRRLVEIGAKLAASPGGTLCATIREWSALKRAYQLFAREEVSHTSVTASHLERTEAALREPGDYLILEDTTSLNFESHLAIKGMGWMGDGRQGLNVHTALATRVERWDGATPVVSLVGLARQEVWSRIGPPKNRKESRKERRNRERESQRWTRNIRQLKTPPSGRRWTFVADREADIFEDFVACRDQHWDFIIRAKEPRRLADQSCSLMDAVAGALRLGTKRVSLRARSATQGRKAMPAREARLEIRAVAVTVKCPADRSPQLAPVVLNVVEAREVGAPPGVEPLHWVLLTTWPIKDIEQVWRVVESYGARWLIEEYHKALKTGVGIEKVQLATRQRIEALLGVLAILAARLLGMKLLAKTEPDTPLPTEVLGPEVLEILEASRGKPSGGWTYATALIAIARLGGFLARRSDGLPGWITIWRGWRRLMDMKHGLELIRKKERSRAKTVSGGAQRSG